MKSVLKRKDLGMILLSKELDDLKYLGTFYQSNYNNNRIILLNDKDFTKKIMIPTLHCLNGFEYSDLVDNAYYANGKINNHIRCYDIETIGATYIDDGDYYNSRYLLAPFIKKISM